MPPPTHPHPAMVAIDKFLTKCSRNPKREHAEYDVALQYTAVDHPISSIDVWHIVGHAPPDPITPSLRRSPPPRDVHRLTADKSMSDETAVRGVA